MTAASIPISFLNERHVLPYFVLDISVLKPLIFQFPELFWPKFREIDARSRNRAASMRQGTHVRTRFTHGRWQYDGKFVARVSSERGPLKNRWDHGEERLTGWVENVANTLDLPLSRHGEKMSRSMLPLLTRKPFLIANLTCSRGRRPNTNRVPFP